MERFQNDERVDSATIAQWWSNIEKLSSIQDIRSSSFSRKDRDVLMKKEVVESIEKAIRDI